MKALKWLRILVAACMFALVTLFFLGLGGGFGLLEKIQLVPAMLGCAVVPLAVWLVVTLLFGRLYCSMVCPMGILQDVLGGLLRWRKYSPRPDRPWVRFVAILAFTVLVIFGGAALAALVDPYSMFGRIASALLQPAAEWGNNLLADHLGVDGSLVLFKREVFVRSVSGVIVAGSALVLLAALVAWKGRLVCNTICPAGAILAAFSKKTAFRIAFDQEKCVKCGICSGACKALCLDGKNQTVDNARCVRCFNCIGVCPKGAISFTAKRRGLADAQERVPPVRGGADAQERVPPVADESRRAFAASAGLAGCAAMALVGSSKCVVDKRAKSTVALPPPGADPEKFRRLCTGCGLCVAKCPKKIIVPAGFTEYGPLGFMMPKLDFAHGYCDPNCTKCGEVCPTGALRPFTVEQKKTMKLGVALFDRKQCVACTENLSCGLCERRCPQKAITLQEKEVKDGKKVKVPVVDFDKCTGCGKCANYCPGGALKVFPRNVEIRKEIGTRK